MRRATIRPDDVIAAGVPADAVELYGFARDVPDDATLGEATHHSIACDLLMTVNDDVPVPNVTLHCEWGPIAHD